MGNHVIAGYGFTAESDWVRVVRRSDGRVLDRQTMPSSHFGLEVRGNVLDVEVGGSWTSYRMDAFAGSSPKLAPLGTRAQGAPAPTPAAAAAAVPWPALPALPARSALPVLPATPPAAAWLTPWIRGAR